jgi:hypothetical protein
MMDDDVIQGAPQEIQGDHTTLRQEVDRLNLELAQQQDLMKQQAVEIEKLKQVAQPKLPCGPGTFDWGQKVTFINKNRSDRGVRNGTVVGFDRRPPDYIMRGPSYIIKPDDTDEWQWREADEITARNTP